LHATVARPDPAGNDPSVAVLAQVEAESVGSLEWLTLPTDTAPTWAGKPVSVALAGGALRMLRASVSLTHRAGGHPPEYSDQRVRSGIGDLGSSVERLQYILDLTDPSNERRAVHGPKELVELCRLVQCRLFWRTDL